MPSPKEIPGFYFDAQKNRYFRIRGSIPGSGSRRLAVPAPSEETTAASSSACSFSWTTYGKAKKGNRADDLLQSRELHGRLVMLDGNRSLFEKEYDKLLVSHKSIWKYQGTELRSDGALGQFSIQLQLGEGLQESKVLLMGGKDGSISLYGIGNQGNHLRHEFSPRPIPAFPVGMERKSGRNIVPEALWTSSEPSRFPSTVTSILNVGMHSQHALVTTLGSGNSGGSVFYISLNGALNIGFDVLYGQRISTFSTYDFTIWTGACDSSGTNTALGTNQGAALLNLETGRLSWLYRGRSDTFSQQFDQSGNVVLCGLRNGSILAVDVRQKRSGSYCHFDPSGGVPTAVMHQRKHNNTWLAQNHRNQGNPSLNCAFMPSSVCSLVTLKSDEQYFMGSSMDGSIGLFDLRLLHRGAVQSYEGQVNSHSHLQLGIDPLEGFVLSGGEDCFLRIWSIKSGKMLFSERFSDSILKTVCWMPKRDQNKVIQNDFAWMGSREGVFCMKGIA